MTGLGAQMGKFKHGIGTRHPFRFPDLRGQDPRGSEACPRVPRIPGLSYRIKTLSDSSGKKVRGVYLVISDWAAWKPVDLPFHMMKLTAAWQSPSPFSQANKAQAGLFNKHAGSGVWWEPMLSAGGKIRLGSLPRPSGRRTRGGFRNWSGPTCFID